MTAESPLSASARLQRALAIAVVGAITAGTAALIAGIAISARRDGVKRHGDLHAD